MRKSLALFTASLCVVASPLFAEISEGLVARYKPVVLNVEKSSSVGLNGESPGQSKATGFIVDAKRGIIATNRHVTGTSPCRVKVVFENGQSAEARLLHYDPWHDFGFFQIDPRKLDFPLQEAVLGSSTGLKEQDEVFMIGNNDAQEYSVKYGRVTNLVLDRGSRHSATIQTSFDRAGGSSGSPVFNAKGEVVAIHYAGTDTTSFELRIEYVKDALDQLRAGKGMRRGEIGVALSLELVSDAQKHFHLPDALAKEVKAVRSDLKRMIIVHSRIPGLSAYDSLLPGDLILAADGTPLGDDLYKFDRIVDGKTGGAVELRAVRNGREFTAKLAVKDAEAMKTARFAQFAGGVFQDLTPELRYPGAVETAGVFLGRTDPGSSMSGVGSGVIIVAVNGTPTPDLDAFIAAARPLKDRDAIYLLVRDSRSAAMRAIPVLLDLKFLPLKVTRWSAADEDWLAEGDAAPASH